MAKLPKSIIKKYGISKKAWAVFRGQKSSKTKTKTARSFNMAKRKGFRKSSKSKSFLNMGNVIKVLAGATVAVAYEVFISPMIPLDSKVKNIIELVIGLVLMTLPKMPMIVRATGGALATVNAYALIYPYIAGLNNNTTSSGGFF